MSFETQISFRYLLSGRKGFLSSVTTFIAAAGVTVGVMALIVVIAVMAGFEQDLEKRILGVTPHVTVSPRPGWKGKLDDLARRVAAFPGVLAAAPVASGQVMLRGPQGGTGVLLYGVDPRHMGPVAALERHVKPGGMDKLYPAPGRRPGLVLGKELAAYLGVYPGDLVSVVAFGGGLGPEGLMPSVTHFSVVGILDSGMYEADSSLALASLDQAMDILGLGRKSSSIAPIGQVWASVANPFSVEKQSAALAEFLGPGFCVSDWKKKNKNLFAALALEKAAMFVILGLIVLVAAFNITGTIVMMVNEKQRDIAVLKAMGATRASILKIFTACGFAVGLVGTVLGAVLGAWLCWLLSHYAFIDLPDDVYYVSTLPVSLVWSDVAMIVGAALAISFLAAVYPARRAAGLDPAKALRYG